jgi:hypothetical protein
MVAPRSSSARISSRQAIKAIRPLRLAGGLLLALSILGAFAFGVCAAPMQIILNFSSDGVNDIMHYTPSEDVKRERVPDFMKMCARLRKTVQSGVI